MFKKSTSSSFLTNYFWSQQMMHTLSYINESLSPTCALLSLFYCLPGEASVSMNPNLKFIFDFFPWVWFFYFYPSENFSSLMIFCPAYLHLCMFNFLLALSTLNHFQWFMNQGTSNTFPTSAQHTNTWMSYSKQRIINCWSASWICSPISENNISCILLFNLCCCLYH